MLSPLDQILQQDVSLYVYLCDFYSEPFLRFTIFYCFNVSQVSYWKVHAESLKDITVQTFIDQYIEEAGKPSSCDPDFKNIKQYDKYQKIGVSQMALPFILFAACFILAVIFKLGKYALACCIGCLYPSRD